MTSTRIHPDLRRAARVLPRHLVGPRSLPAIRVAERLAARRPAPTGVLVERVGSVPVRLHLPPGYRSGDVAPTVLWIHGGGYVIGLAAQDDAWCAELARRLGAVVAAVDYRTAPEHPHPAPIEDCHAALVWLAARPDVDAGRIAVAGASAGGGLAAALAALAVDRGRVRPAFQLLVYPMLDDGTTATSPDARDHRLWDARSNRFGWASYLGPEPRSAGWEVAVPARRDDLAGLPPAWVGVGTLDLFHDEDVAHAERLRAAGVPCDLDVVTGAFHGFDGIVPKAAVSRAFRDAQVGALAGALTTA